MKRILKVFLTFVITLTLFSTLPPFTANAASYSSDYRYWSQGASSYTNMRNFGCWVVAQSKLIYEANIDRSTSFNPDSYMLWEQNNGHLNSSFNQVNGGYAPQTYAASKGKTLTYLGSTTSSVENKIWDNISKGYFTLIYVKTSKNQDHYVMIANSLSAQNNQLYCYNSYSGYTSAAPSSVASRNYTIYRVYTYTTNSDTTTSPSVTFTRGFAGYSDSITQNNAFLHATVSKPSSYKATKFGIAIRKSGTSTWEKVYSHPPVQDYVGTSTIHLTYDIRDEVGYQLSDGTSYIFQVFAVIDNKDYYSEEMTFTTTSYASVNDIYLVNAPDGFQALRTGPSTSYSKLCNVPNGTYITVTKLATDGLYDWGYTTYNGQTGWVCLYYTTKHTAHSYGEWECVQSATCTANGTKKRACASCGHIEYGTLLSGGHNYSSSFTIDTPASCTTQGSKSKHCAWCDSRIEVTAISPSGHSYGSWQTVTAATCTATGSQKRICANCSHSEHKTTSPSGHNFSSSWTVDKVASCTVSGTKSHHCSNCSAKADITTISSLGHSWSDWKITKQATTDNTGLKTRTCTRSGCSSKETSIIAKLSSDGHSHSFGQWITETAVTCTTNGIQKRVCSKCDEFETLTVSAIGHSYGEWSTETAATCTTNGFQKRTCKNCDHTETNTVPALGHNFTTWKLIDDTSSKYDNVWERICQRCDETETQYNAVKSEPSSGSKPAENVPDSTTNSTSKPDKNTKSDNAATPIIIVCIILIVASIGILIILKTKKN